ncbi:YheC/YheD family protein [Alkalihalobacterium elongatum]|uniref:YheC/YheD family protein n=1 Tax=Alkalihalobacterium elongatum TaxID=2675466 RepID=UPI001C1FBF36|nr:YheC/YheD family protein [Alkalihalobacterium elongatum]
MPEEKLQKPILGVCIGRKENEKRLLFQRLIKSRLLKHNNLPFNTIIVFTMDQLNLIDLTVSGECLFLCEQKVKSKKGTYPFPDVIYIQSELQYEEIKPIEKIIPGKVFNNHFYNKYECISILSKNKRLMRYLPETELLKNQENLLASLNRFNEVFLKPINGHSGKGIFFIKLLGSGKVSCVSKRQELMFESFNDFSSWFFERYQQSNYMIQRAINTAKWKGMATDVRLNMNKNSHGLWEVSFLVGRLALNQIFVSAGNRGNITIHLNQMLKQLFPNRNRHKINSLIVELGYNICQTFDKTKYHMGDLGIDLGIDQNGNLWIFEVNHLPYPFHNLQDQSMTLPLDYAYYLTQKSKGLKPLISNIKNIFNRKNEERQ